MGGIEAWLSGKKTYLLAAGAFIWAFAGVINGWVDLETGGLVAWLAASMAAMRGGIDKWA